jgi:hypothetical protein
MTLFEPAQQRRQNLERVTPIRRPGIVGDAARDRTEGEFARPDLLNEIRQS